MGAEADRPVQIASLIGDGYALARVPVELVNVGGRVRQSAAREALHGANLQRVGRAVDKNGIGPTDGEDTLSAPSSRQALS